MQVACALLMAGENLDSHTVVKDVLIEMGTYFQVQVPTDFLNLVSVHSAMNFVYHRISYCMLVLYL